MKISVVCPFYNEEAIIAVAARHFIAKLESGLEDWELILVDDGSKDGSRAALTAALGDINPSRVRVLGYQRNMGRGHALKTGIDAAIGDIIVTTEVDGSWGEDIVERLVQALTSDPETDVVIASPHLPGGGLANVPPHRILLTTMGNRLIRTFVSRSLSMYTGMTRAYRREVIQPLPVREHGKEFHPEVALKLLTLGFRIKEIPATITWGVHKTENPAQAPRKSSTRILKTIGTHLVFSLVGKPSQYFALSAGASLLLGMLFILWGVINLLTGKVAAFVGMFGLLLLMLSLLFTGFSVLFSLLTALMRGQWEAAYPRETRKALAARKIRQVFPPTAG
jgi:dolichol-phosphate mannosyltransferase